MLADLAPPSLPARSTFGPRMAVGLELALGIGSIGFGIYRLTVAKNPRDRAIDVQVTTAGLLALVLAYYHGKGIT